MVVFLYKPESVIWNIYLLEIVYIKSQLLFTAKFPKGVCDRLSSRLSVNS